MLLFGGTCSKSFKADQDDVVRRIDFRSYYYLAALYIRIVVFSMSHEGFSLDYRSGVRLPKKGGRKIKRTLQKLDGSS